MLIRCLRACLILTVPLLCLAAADDSRPACVSQNQGHMWPEAANHDPRLLFSLMRCGQLLICVRGTWHYHWEAPSIRFDQLARRAKLKASKPPACEVQSLVDGSSPEPPTANEKVE
jgi:hypothetical protein